MNTFDRHLVREWLQILGLVLLATLGLLVVQVMYDSFDDLQKLGMGGRDIAMYFLATMPSFLALVLPIALLLSLMFTLGQLHRANELTAMRAAGVSFLRLTRPVWVLGLFCCGLMWWLNATIVPWSVEESRRLRENFELTAQKEVPLEQRGLVYSVGFDNRAAHRMWFINRYSKGVDRAYGVTVTTLQAANGIRTEQSRIEAAEAWRAKDGKGWIFQNGREHVFDEGVVASNRPFQVKRFEDFDEDPALMLLIDRRPADLSVFELRRLIDHFTRDSNPKGMPYAVRYYSLLADTLAPLIVIAIAIPFTVSGLRVNPAVGVSKSIGLFFLYYLLANLATALATKGILPPQYAAWLPNCSLAVMAAWFFARLR